MDIPNDCWKNAAAVMKTGLLGPLVEGKPAVAKSGGLQPGKMKTTP